MPNLILVTATLVGGLLPSALGSDDPEYRTLKRERSGYFSAKARYLASTAQGVRGAAVDDSRRLASLAVSEFVRDADSAFKSLGKPPTPWELDWMATATAFAPELASTLVQTVAYTGGAHALTSLSGSTFAVVNGKPTSLTWNQASGPENKAKTKELVLARVMASKRRITPSPETPEITDEALNEFVVSPGGVAWLFDQGELDAMSEGATIAKVSWQDLAPVLRPESPVIDYLHRRTLFAEWEFVELQGMDDSIKIVPKGRYTLRIGLDGKLSGRVDVNQFSGDARIVDNQVRLQVRTVTLAAPPPSSYHDAYLRNLGDVRSAVLRGEEMYLALMADAGIMKFRRASQ